MGRLLLTTMAVAALSLLTTLAAAEPRDDARQHFDHALELVDAGDLEEAVDEFLRAYELMPHHTVLYNLGQTYQALGRPVEAMDAFERFLRDGGTEVSDAQRAEVRRELAKLALQVAEVTLHVEPPQATVAVDGKDLGPASALGPSRWRAGTHHVVVSCAGYLPNDREITVAGNERVELRLALKPQAASPPPPATVDSSLLSSSEPPPPAPPPVDIRRPVGVAAAAGGVTLGVVGLGVLVRSGQRYSEYEREATALDRAYSEPNLDDPDGLARRQDDNDRLIESIHRHDWIAGGLMVGGGLLAATGAVLYFTARRARATEASLSVNGHAVRIGLRTAF